MASDRNYEPCKFGPMVQIAFTNVAKRIRLVSPSSGRFPRSFELRITQTARVLQGGVAVEVTATNGRYIKPAERWRIDVDDETEAFISIMRGDSTNGNVEISVASDVATNDPPAAV